MKAESPKDNSPGQSEMVAVRQHRATPWVHVNKTNQALSVRQKSFDAETERSVTRNSIKLRFATTAGSATLAANTSRLAFRKEKL